MIHLKTMRKTSNDYEAPNLRKSNLYCNLTYVYIIPMAKVKACYCVYLIDQETDVCMCEYIKTFLCF